ncbi:fructokinase [Bacteroidia bacterium]|nr:fructokinase [Bacteroidia bacterium]
MRKVIGIGEIILDVIFKNKVPEKAVPGGSTFNCMVSLGRRNLPVCFISELGNDMVGNLIKDFMRENNIQSEYVAIYEDGNSPISLAFLDENNNADYQFYRDFPEERLSIGFPEIKADDVLVMGSYFAVNPELRKYVSRLVSTAKKQNAIVYYDINFRKAHARERQELFPYFTENFRQSTIVRCSEEDLEVLFPGESFEEIYQNRIAPVCPNFIVTQGEESILLQTRFLKKEYPVEQVTPVSTIGAGDNFNAGLIYGLMEENITSDNLACLPETQWDKLILSGMKFATEVCLSMDNYVR